MTPLKKWRKRAQELLEAELEEFEEEQSMWEQMTHTGPFALHTENRSNGRGGSRPGKRPNIDREREKGHERIWKDYFQEQPVYSDATFRRRYRMRRTLFWRVLNAVCEHDSYFLQKRDAAGVKGLSSIQKITCALRMLALGVGADALDEYCRIAESTALETLSRFVRAIRAVFEAEYLRQPTKEDLEKQLEVNKRRGFPGMFASLDCMHYVWKNCPVAWQGQFTNKDGNRSIVLEAIADQSLWIWHAYFGLPGGNNDLNVLDRSPLVNNFLRSDATDLSYSVNGRSYGRYYLLVDGIYPEWSIFVTTIHAPQGPKRKWFAKCQEAARKDVERAFGVLQARWGIIKNPARSWHIQTITDICIACVILHNMIIEDEKLHDVEDCWDQNPTVPVRRGGMTTDWDAYLQAHRMIEDSSTHYMLRNDLIDHLWAQKGERDDLS